MIDYTALLDANVLYPAPMRDIFLQLAVKNLFRAKWTAEIHREWMEALLRKEPRRDRAALERTGALMDQSVRDCIVTGYEVLIPGLDLPDPGDRHVLAAAIAGRCDVIVTQNLRDFPDSALAPHRVEAQHPDTFLCNQLDFAPVVFRGAIRKLRARLKNPAYPVPEYLAILQRVGLAATATALESFSEMIWRRNSEPARPIQKFSPDSRGATGV